jgi:hypothetical protein
MITSRARTSCRWPVNPSTSLASRSTEAPSLTIVAAIA